MVLAPLISAVLWVSSLVFFVCMGVVYLLLAIAFSPKALHPVARLACRGMLLAGGQRLRVTGQFPDLANGPYIYVFNHSSLLDTLIVIAVLPEFTGAIGKKEQFSIPIWGWILRRWGAVPIDRNQLKGAIESLDQVSEAVGNGLSLLIAPEGTRSPDGRLGPFKKGPFHIAVQQDVAVVPMAITGAYAAKRKGSWLLRPGTIKVEVLSQIVPSESIQHTVESLRDTTRAHLAKALGDEDVLEHHLE